MHGLLIVDKPAGMTSAGVVRLVKRRFGCKTGHLGTLDPFATGVLPLCLGEATKIAQFLNSADKQYSGHIRLGSATDTGDRTGTVTVEAEVPPIRRVELDAVRDRLIGVVRQVPPMYSAVKRDGTPLYKLARRGVEVEREPRTVHIHTLRLDLVNARTLAVEVACSKGTYVRVLAEEIAVALGTVGHLESLRRTQFGRFDISAAYPLDSIEPGSVAVLSMRDALVDLMEVRLESASARRARQGFEPVLAEVPAGKAGDLAKLLAPDGSLVAVVGMPATGGWQFLRVFGVDAHAAA